MCSMFVPSGWHPHSPRHHGVRFGQTFLGPLLSLAEISLARVIGAVGEPWCEEIGAYLLCNVDALLQVGSRLAADRPAGVRDTAQFVIVVLKQIGIDRPDFQTERLGVASHL